MYISSLLTHFAPWLQLERARAYLLHHLLTLRLVYSALHNERFFGTELNNSASRLDQMQIPGKKSWSEVDSNRLPALIP